MPIPYPYPSNITSIIDLIRYANVVTTVHGTGLMGLGILITIGVVAFLTSKASTYERAFAYSAFLTFLSALLLRFMNLIHDTILWVSIALLIGAVILLFFEREKENV